MDTRFKDFIYVGILLFTPLEAFSSSGWTEYSHITELTPTIHERYLVKLNTSKNPSGCKQKEIYYQDYSSAGSDLMFRTLLEAVSSGKMAVSYTHLTLPTTIPSCCCGGGGGG